MAITLNKSLIEDIQAALQANNTQFFIELRCLCQTPELIVEDDKKEYKLLHWIALKSSEETLKRLIEKESTWLTVLDNSGQMFLHAAAAVGRSTIIDFFLNKRCYHPKVRDNEGNTPVHMAVYSEDMTVMRKLLEFWKEGLNIQNNLGRSPLSFAVMMDRFEMVRFLLNLNADPRIKDIYGNTALHLAVDKGNHTMISPLLEHDEKCIHDTNYQGLTPFMIAENREYRGIMDILLQRSISCSLGI